MKPEGDEDEIVNIDHEGMVENISMSYREARYDDSQSTIEINALNQKSERSSAGVGSSMYAEKRAAIKKSLFGQKSQESIKSPTHLKKNMAIKFA